MKKHLSKILAILLLIMCFVFFLMGRELLDLRDSYEVALEAIETLQIENKDLQDSLEQIERDKNELKLQIEELTLEKTELESKVKELSIQKTQTLAEQKKEEEKAIAESQTVIGHAAKPSLDTDGKKVVYLTFDDGPSANTEQILDILKQYNIKATFFVIGNAKNKELYKRIVREGHSIGNHTFSHNYKNIYSSVEAFMEDFEKLNAFLEEITGVQPSIVRFPGGSNNQVSHKYGGEEIMKEIVKTVANEGYQYFDWNVSSLDAEKVTQDKEVIVNAVLEGAKDKTNAIVLMHDSAPKTTTVEALPEIIEGLKKQGFTFKTLDKDSYAPHFLKID